MGIYKELKKIGKPDMEAYIVAGRLARGEEDYEKLSGAERNTVIKEYSQELGKVES